MKTKFFITSFAVIFLLLFAVPVDSLAQKKPKGPPPWAPAHGFRSKTRHVYFPDHNFYFDIQNKVYIYISGGKWLYSAKLPAIFVDVNLKGAYKIELELEIDNPHKYNSSHIVKYKKHKKKVHKKSKGNPGKGNKIKK
ncbi:MAG: hypothetical protein K8R54_11590 [Bacteroidales bacterium]|nr:hypothetical protein [Bacteroidales bacterium]